MSGPRSWVAAAVAALLLGSGCTDATPPAAGSRSPSTAAGERGIAGRTASSTPAEPPAPPQEGACYRLALDVLAEPSSSEGPVDCSDPHTTRTIHVGRLDTVVDGHAVSVDSEHAREQMAEDCSRRLARFLGGTAEERRLSRFQVVWFSPTLRQSDRGADWFRCDVVALAGEGELFDLDRPGRLRGVLERDGALRTYGLCGTAAPGAGDFSRVICGRPHAWRAISTIPIDGGPEYPGQPEVRAAGDEVCRDQALALAEDPLRFRYGWEWPTAEQWEAGQHYGYCWVPD